MYPTGYVSYTISVLETCKKEMKTRQGIDIQLEEF